MASYHGQYGHTDNPEANRSMIRIGTAGWSIPRQSANLLPVAGSGLERYASRLNAVEINSSFYRSHRLSTWARWRDSTADAFRFSVKMPKLITHTQKLAHCTEHIDGFLSQVAALGHKLAVLLVQLPPKLAYDEDLADRFFSEVRAKTRALVACEPRHPSWFTPEAEALFIQHRIARVAADPAICPGGALPAGWTGLRYWRLHGSPEMYRSSYANQLTSYAERLADGHDAERQSWCIFDNTASGAAAGDALSLTKSLTP